MDPNLPPLTWNDCWEGVIVLPSWSGFQTRRGPYAAVSSPAPSDGSARLRFDTGATDEAPLTTDQVAAYKWLVEHEAEVGAAVLGAIFDEYPRFREEYLDCYDDEDEDALATVPELESADQLKGMMGLSSVFVLPEAKDGVSYVGFEFGCEWEREHGLGVLTHKGRVVEIGSAPTAFDGHRAKDDSEGSR